jgi:hypothetical protein
MSNEPKKRLRAWNLWGIILVILLAYPLSFGPAYRFAQDSHDPDTQMRTISTIYAPIGWLCMRSKPTKAVLFWYLGLWIRRH